MICTATAGARITGVGFPLGSGMPGAVRFRGGGDGSGAPFGTPLFPLPATCGALPLLLLAAVRNGGAFPRPPRFKPGGTSRLRAIGPECLSPLIARVKPADYGNKCPRVKKTSPSPVKLTGGCGATVPSRRQNTQERPRRK